MSRPVETASNHRPIHAPNTGSSSGDDSVKALPYPSGKPLYYMLRFPVWLYRLGFGEIMNAAHVMILTTRGRRSGQPRHTAVEYRAHGHSVYVISAWGERPQWFKNLLSDPVVTLRRGRILSTARAHVVEDKAEALRVLYLFRKTAPAIYDLLLARASSIKDVNGRKLPEISDQFTIVCFNPLDDIQGPQGVRDDLRNALRGGLVMIGLLLLLAVLPRSHPLRKRP